MKYLVIELNGIPRKNKRRRWVFDWAFVFFNEGLTHLLEQQKRYQWMIFHLSLAEIKMLSDHHHYKFLSFSLDMPDSSVKNVFTSMLQDENFFMLVMGRTHASKQKRT